VDWIKVRAPQRKVIGRGTKNNVKCQFEADLEGFLKDTKFDGNILREEMGRQKYSADALFKRRRKYLGAEKWKESVGLTKRQVETQSETAEDRGITVNDGGTVLFGTAQNVFPTGVSEGSLCEQPSAVVKRAGWIDQRTCQLCLRDDVSQLEAEETMEIVAFGEDSSGDVISTSGDSGNKKEDDSTEMTTVGSVEEDMTTISSMEGDSSASSGGNHRHASMDWTVVVNGMRYIGNSRPRGNSSFSEIAESKEDSSAPIGETTKERNRRLLIQERAAQAGRKKVRKTKQSGRCFNQVQTLQTVEEDSLVEEHSIAIDDTEEEEPKACNCLREAEIVLRRKVRLLTNNKKVRSPQQKKIKLRGSSVRGTMSECWRLATREFSYIIRLYSSLAVKYVMVPSNRRFKPGD